MNSTAQTYLQLARLLRVDAGAGYTCAKGAGLAVDPNDWVNIVKAGDKEHMTGALAVALGHQENCQLPQHVRSALNRRLLMGTELNKRIKGQAEEAIRTFNAAGCTPMLLKGALYLFETPPEDLGGRFMRDIDLVVPKESIDTCVRSLRAIGYVPEGEGDDWTYHWRPMHHPDHIVAIELHVRPGEQRSFLTVDEAWSKAVHVNAPGLQMVSLAPTHRIAHNIFHSEIQDFGYVLGSICLRQLYDLAGICARFENEIDWQDVSARMQRHGMGGLFRARMHMATELLGSPRPPVRVNTLRARLHLKRCLIQLRWPNFRKQFQRLAASSGRVLKSHHIDLIYGCGTFGLNLQLHRMKHVWYLLNRHRKDLRRSFGMYGKRFE